MVEGLQKSTDVEELIEDKRILVVVKICLILIRLKSLKIQDIFQNTIEFIIKIQMMLLMIRYRLIFSKYMLQLANYDDDLQYFLLQHTAVLLTADTKYVEV